MIANVIKAYGCLTPIHEISDTLHALRVGHTVVDRQRQYVRHNDGLKQPAWPVLLPNIGMIKRYECKRDQQILLVCDSMSALKTCNLGVLRPDDMELNLRRALERAVAEPTPMWQLVSKEMSFAEYVKHATKPSFLNDLQTEFYSINPYDLRKEVQALVIAYLANVESKTKMRTKLDTSHKLARLRQLVNDPKCDALRAAVARVQRGESEQTVALATSFETFELLYIARSSAKTSDKK